MKIVYILIFSIISLYSFEVQNKLVVNIPEQADSTIRIPAFDLKVGESGIITREVNDNEFIIANAVVKSIKDGVAEIIYSPFTSMNEEYMPKLKATPTQNDKIIFRILYNRALIIAPNQNAYQEILAMNKNMDFIHPDIFATFLAKNDINMPKPNDFKDFCDRFNVGLIFIANDDICVLDCQSFKIIGKDSFNRQDNTQKLPFFTRLSDESIDEIFNIKKFSNFDSYFRVLIESNNMQNLKVESNLDSNAKYNPKIESNESKNTKPNSK
ncbi:MAG: plasminogen-binding N-terminal domain-containing protein [Helicobacteraceae bacterium]|nr:plasminogen-binding N-terminal domain-containing protein [Helicobacteraceae bacterium]